MPAIVDLTAALARDEAEEARIDAEQRAKREAYGLYVRLTAEHNARLALAQEREKLFSKPRFGSGGGIRLGVPGGLR